jgi:hypothetical protein
MNLDARLVTGGDGVAQRHRGVGVTARVDEYSIEAFARFVYPIYQLTFVVTLTTCDADAQLARQRFELSVYISERVLPIHLRFTQTEQVEVRSMQNEDVGG